MFWQCSLYCNYRSHLYPLFYFVSIYISFWIISIDLYSNLLIIFLAGLKSQKILLEHSSFLYLYLLFFWYLWYIISQSFHFSAEITHILHAFHFFHQRQLNFRYLNFPLSYLSLIFALSFGSHFFYMLYIYIYFKCWTSNIRQ